MNCFLHQMTATRTHAQTVLPAPSLREGTNASVPLGTAELSVRTVSVPFWLLDQLREPFLGRINGYVSRAKKKHTQNNKILQTNILLMPHKMFVHNTVSVVNLKVRHI